MEVFIMDFVSETNGSQTASGYEWGILTLKVVYG